MNVTNEVLDVIVIGAGQAGLACGWHLQQHNLRFLILDAERSAGGNWRNYYDSLKLFSPAAYSSLPGMRFPAEPDHYPLRDEVVRYLEDYAKAFKLPVRQSARVQHVRREHGLFRLQTDDGESFCSKALIVCTGGFNQPFIPDIQGLQGFLGRSLHSAEYRNADGFGGQRVVVVGAANSAVQIAYELAHVGNVVLASREPIRFFPQKMLGLDFHRWLKWSGLEKTRWLSDQSTPVLDDGIYRRALKQRLFERKPMFEAITPTGVIWADGQHTEVDSLVFATGFCPNLKFLSGLECPGDEYWAHRNGQAKHLPGLYFVGLPKQRNFASATLRGVGQDAAYIMPSLMRFVRDVPV
ncbi:monooxygenase [Pseudomonas ogarae]|uniref:flavin-containing monooxygenase n=1 Tax=Pseudomonas ogarae (strain DSM 112162 / CECT 30235 / F113) TaxID=1114970 RepID=UPI0009A4214A|nr:NAD(P)/FAD-dependent oxidoreductase [Pseudomonas ogarae]OPG69455.1 monooxygenase [Pseudomonas ogarae]OPG77246.1 monooxygenase [Pseudomonas ogarae]